MNKTFLHQDISYCIRNLSSQDEGLVNELFAASKDFFLLSEGQEAQGNNNFFTELPPNKTKEDKYLFGLFEQATLLGVVDLVADYPQSGEWIIGLQLLSPSCRGKGLGQLFHINIKTFAKEKGACRLRVAVLNQNKAGIQFWQKMGFTLTESKEATFGLLKSKVHIVHLDL